MMDVGKKRRYYWFSLSLVPFLLALVNSSLTLYVQSRSVGCFGDTKIISLSCIGLGLEGLQRHSPCKALKNVL